MQEKKDRVKKYCLNEILRLLDFHVISMRKLCLSRNESIRFNC